VTLGRQLRRPDLSTTGARWCEAALPERSVYRFLARERTRLFPPELFADLFQATGRRSVPPSILAVVMVLQRLEGLSDREAADRFAFDVRWRYAAGAADAVAGVRGQGLMLFLVRVHMSVAGQAMSLQGTTSVRGLEPVLEPVAGPVDGDDVAVVQQPVQDGRGQHVVAEHAAPLAEGLVAGG
jgi:Transposase domain (DUF772)